MKKADLKLVEDGPPADFGLGGGPDIEGMFTAIECGRLRRKLAKAEAFLATIAKGVNDPSFYAAKYWGGYEKYDAAMKAKLDGKE